MRTINSITLFFIIFNFGFAFSDCSYNSPTELTTSSPNNIYKVRFIEKEDGANYLTKFSVQRQDKTIITDRIFYHDSGEFIGSGLKTNWLSETILSLSYLDVSQQNDEISVENQTNKVIRYLKISAVDKFLLLELQPHSKTKLIAHPQTDKTVDISWINSVGMFDDGQEIPTSGMNFRIRGKYTSPAHYCIFIKEDTVTVQSKDFEGFLDNGDVPEAKNPSCQ